MGISNDYIDSLTLLAGLKDSELESLLQALLRLQARRAEVKTSRARSKSEKRGPRVKADKSTPNRKVLTPGEFHSGAVASVPTEYGS